MFARMPVIIGREPDSEIAAVFEAMAAMMAREGLVDGLDWNDARGAIATMAFDLMKRGPDHLLIRAGWMRAEVHNGGPLHEPFTRMGMGTPTERLRQIPPRNAGSEPVHDALDHRPIITKRTTRHTTEDGINGSIRAHCSSFNTDIRDMPPIVSDHPLTV